MRHWALLLIFTAILAGQGNAPHMNDWTPPAGETRLAPLGACAALRQQTGFEFTILTATELTAGPGGAAYCRVVGLIQPEIRFEVNLPKAWNTRLLMTGNGGFAGEDLDAPQWTAMRHVAMEKGFVHTRSNTGHDARREPLGTFAVNPQKLYDYAFRSLHVTAETAKRLAKVYYGSAPVRSYYMGCSTGGRQGLMLAQRFPDDFDGIVAGAPVLDFTGTVTQYAVMDAAFRKTPIPFAKLGLLATKVYAKCDGVDGLVDGLIDDPWHCDFQPARHLPKCSNGNGADCFTAGEIATLTTIYSPVMVQGKQRYPGWPLSAEIAGPNGRSGWDRWLVNEDGSPTIGNLFATTFFRYLAFDKQDPQLTLAQIDPERDLPRMEGIHQLIDATNPDLSPFRNRQGKLLMYFGWADAALNAQRAVEYYEEVQKVMGPGTADFFRFYTLPGIFHCGGGVGCGSFDPLAAVIRWVEEGKAPEALTTARVEQGKVLRTRPICPYPQRSKYTGTGSIDDAANFRCVAP